MMPKKKMNKMNEKAGKTKKKMITKRKGKRKMIIIRRLIVRIIIRKRCRI